LTCENRQPTTTQQQQPLLVAAADSQSHVAKVAVDGELVPLTEDT